MSTTIQLRRGTAAAWTGADPTLAEGEVGWETDTGKFKFGDGLSAWTTLAYAAGGSLTVEGDTGSVAGVTTLQVEGAGGASVAVTEPVAGTALATVTAGGGGAAGAVRWLGPCKVGTFDGQVIQSGDVPEGGTFTITINGETTAAIDFDAEEAALAAAIAALPSIGVDEVVVEFFDDPGGKVFETSAYIVFKDARATGMLTIDATNLTGPASPYLPVIEGTGHWTVEMLTPAVGDIIEDFLHSVVTAFDAGALLAYTDDLVDSTGNAPVWSNPTSWSGVPGGGLRLDEPNGFTNFSGNGSAGAEIKPTALQAMQVAPVGNGTTDSYSNLPAVALNSVPVYSYLNNVATAPTQGEVWIWVKVATPAPLMD